MTNEQWLGPCPGHFMCVGHHRHAVESQEELFCCYCKGYWLGGKCSNDPETDKWFDKLAKQAAADRDFMNRAERPEDFMDPKDAA